MRKYIEIRVLSEAKEMLNKQNTVRSLAKQFSVSKSTVYIDLTTRLKRIDFLIYKEVSKVLNLNLSQRHIRGGKSTQEKYLKLRRQRLLK